MSAQKLELVTQGETSVAQGGVPVFSCSSPSNPELIELMAQTINFMRSGCPAVQWLFPQDTIVDEDDGVDLKRRLERLIGMIQRPEEVNLKILAPFPHQMVRNDFCIEFVLLRPVK